MQLKKSSSGGNNNDMRLRSCSHISRKLGTALQCIFCLSSIGLGRVVMTSNTLSNCCTVQSNSKSQQVSLISQCSFFSLVVVVVLVVSCRLVVLLSSDDWGHTNAFGTVWAKKNESSFFTVVVITPLTAVPPEVTCWSLLLNVSNSSLLRLRNDRGNGVRKHTSFTLIYFIPARL